MNRYKRRLAALWLTLLLAAPGPVAQAQPEHDDAVVLSSVLSRVHDRSDPHLLRRMMTHAERRRFDEQGVPAQLQRLLRHHGVTRLVTCTAESPDPGPGAPLAGYRCAVLCQRDGYTVHVRLSPPDPPAARAIERLWLAAPALDPDPAAPNSTEAPLFGAALLLCALGTIRLRRAAPDRPHAPPPPEIAGVREAVLAVRLLSGAALAGALPWLAHRLAPTPTWGHTWVRLLCLASAGLGLGLLWQATVEHRRRSGSLLPAAGTGALALMLGLWALARALPASADAALGHEGAALLQGQGRYQLPLSPEHGPAYVRAAGPLDFLYLYSDGRSCHGPAPGGCRGFGLPVLAPADGEVVYADDRRPDLSPGARDRDYPTGNYVLLSHDGEYSLLGPLQHGSLAVHPGQRVRAGQLLARIGHSGDSDQPHLSFEVWPELQALPGGARRPVRLRQHHVHGLLGVESVTAEVPQPGQLIAP